MLCVNAITLAPHSGMREQGMHLGLRARITIAVGLSAAALFLLLGLRELQRQGTAPAPIRPGPARPAARLVVLASAARAIAIGETVTAAMIRNAPDDPARFPLIATAGETIGKVATRPLAAGSLIPRDALDQAAGLAVRVPFGMRAASIETSAEIAVAGLLRPGDKVDVAVVYPGADALSGARGAARSRADTLLQNVLVLAVGDTVVGAPPGGERTAAAPAPARTVTLALAPGQVSVLSLARSTGALYLSLRNPADGVQVRSAAIVSSAPLPGSNSTTSCRSATIQRPERQRPKLPTSEGNSQVLGSMVSKR